MTRVIIAATPVYGHAAPLLTIAAELVDRGHHVTFLSGSAFKAAAESSGATFVALNGNADFDVSDPAAFPDRACEAIGPAQIDFDVRHLFVDPIAQQHQALQALLREARHEKPGGPVVLLHDTVFLGMWPVLLGAPGLRPNGVIGIGVTPLPLTSIDTAPFGLGLAPDNSESGRARNRELNSLVAHEVFVRAQGHLVQVLRELGANLPPPFVFDGMVSLPDQFLQLSIVELEYERSDAPTGLRYVGALPTARLAFSPPSWWSRVLEAKQVVAVSQGTIANRDFNELIKPTLLALADMNVVVIAVTGRSGVDLGPLPANALVAEFIPFDHLMPCVDVLVSNGGYGGIQQALGHGVPLVLAGQSEDKIEVTARAAHTGAAINLLTSRPEVGAIRMAVHTVLSDPRYKLHARRLQAQYVRHNAFAAVDACVHEFGRTAPVLAAQEVTA